MDGAVLLLGEAGAGKSDVALRLIAMGARLLCDDQTLLFAEGDKLFAESVSSLHGRMEIRGVGIVALEAAGPAPVILAVMLNAHAEIPRLPESLRYALSGPLEALEGPPLLHLSPFEAATPAKIAAAAAALSRGAFVAGLVSPLSGPFF
jgi:serine kinase of HPr protein (carbohydrate metabolism regulator)